MEALVTMEERKAFWRYEKYQKWFRKHLGRDWIGQILDAEEKLNGIESRKKLGEYLLRMHQIETCIWIEKNRNKVPPTTEDVSDGMG